MSKLKLKMDESWNTIPEVFGVKDDIIKSIRKDLVIRITMNDVLHNGAKVKTAILREYLDSKEFKALAWDIKTENDYFMLGYIFSDAIEHSQDLLNKLAEKIDEAFKSGGFKDPIEALKSILADKRPTGRFTPQRGGIPMDESGESPIDKMFKQVRETVKDTVMGTKLESKDKDKKSIPN